MDIVSVRRGVGMVILAASFFGGCWYSDSVVWGVGVDQIGVIYGQQKQIEFMEEIRITICQ